MTIAYPLTWPEHIRRSPLREKGTISASLPAALENVKTSLRLFAKDSAIEVKSLVISSNVTLGAERPDDPGVAVWFVWDGLQVCIPVDRYTTVAANLQAIHHVIEARRVEMRHGTLALVRATFQGFSALPPPTSAGPARPRHWTEVLGIPATAKASEVDAAFRAASKKAHPDLGGDAKEMAEINRARAEALKAIGGEK